MKTRTMLVVLACLMALTFLVGCGSGKYTPKSNEELYGTWINEQSPVAFNIHKMVFSANTAKEYERVSDSNASIVDKLEITSKWMDSEGNIWYKGLATITGGTFGDIGSVGSANQPAFWRK